MAKLITVNASLAMQVVFELHQTKSSFSMVADGVDSCLRFNAGPFEKSTTLTFHDYPDHRITSDNLMEALLAGELTMEQAQLYGTSLSFGPGKIYSDNELVFELEPDEDDCTIRLDYPTKLDGAEPYRPKLAAITTCQQLISDEVIDYHNGLWLNESCPDFCDDFYTELLNTATPDYKAWLKRIFRAKYYGLDRYGEVDLDKITNIILTMEKYRISFASGLVYINDELFDVSPYFN